MGRPVQPLSIIHATADGRRVLVLRGEVDLETAPGLIAAFTRAAGEDEPIAVDLVAAGGADAGGASVGDSLIAPRYP
jgi:ABC-type transporter Mla MlaB component